MGAKRSLLPWGVHHAIFLAGSPLDAVERVVLWVLYGHARGGSCLCWPSDRLIAAEARYCERKVRSARVGLRERKLIDWRQVATRKGRVNVYNLKWRALEALAAACGKPVKIMCITGLEVVENPVESEGGSGTSCRMGPAPPAGRVRHHVPGNELRGTSPVEVGSTVAEDDDDEVSQCEVT